MPTPPADLTLLKATGRGRHWSDDLLAGRVESIAVRAVAALALGHSALVEPLELFVHLLELESGGDLDALRDVLLLEAAAGEHDERLGQLGRCARRERNVLGLVEMAVQDFALSRRRIPVRLATSPRTLRL